MTNAALRVQRGVFEGLWLGLLSREELAALDHDYYHRSGQYTQESWNRRGLFGWEQEAVDRHFSTIDKIVVTAAGGGREVLALAEAGYRVVGFEPHPELAESGSRLLEAIGIEARIESSERDRWPACTDAEGAIVGWASYMLIPGRRRRIEFLREACEHLPHGAPVLLSFFHRDGGDNVRFRVTTRTGSAIRRLRRQERVELGDALAPEFVHFFTRAEIEDELAAAHLELVDFGTTDYGWAVARTGLKDSEAESR